MRSSLAALLACPLCFGPLALEALETGPALPGAPGDPLVYEGVLACGPCGMRYPVHRGVPALAVLDHRWASCLDEMIARRLIRQETLSGSGNALRDAAYARQSGTHLDQADAMTRDALECIDFSQRPRILDVGVGAATTSRALAERGAEVVALDPELANLYEIDLAGYEGLVPQETLETPGGRVLRLKSEPPFPGHFARIFASAHRLPFASASFDATFCRSVIHHLDRIAPVLREMQRVTRPGGLLILCAEPIRSVFEGESWLLACDIDAHRGLNERRPRLLEYLVPQIGRSAHLRVQYFPWGIADNTLRVMRALGYDYSRHLRAGEWVRGWKIAKLAPVTGGATFVSQRTGRPLAPPAEPVDAPRLPPDALVRLYSPQQGLAGLHAGLEAGTAELARLRRRLLEGARWPASRVDASARRSRALQRGFYEPIRIGKVLARPTLGEACITLRRRPADRTLRIRLVPVAPGLTHRIALAVNEHACGVREVVAPVTLSVPLPETEGSIVDIRLRNEILTVLAVCGREVEAGVGVRSAELRP